MSKPNMYYDIEEVPRSKNVQNKKKTNEEFYENIKLENNLDIKFIVDQEELVKKLEKQLEGEKNARKKLDEQFATKLKELELANKRAKSAQKTQNIQSAKIIEHSQVAKTPHSQYFPKSAKTAYAEKPLSAQPQVLVHNTNLTENPRIGSAEEKKHDSKGGYIYENPTHDISPIVLKAQKIPNKTKEKPSKMQTGPVQKIDNTKTEPIIKKDQFYENAEIRSVKPYVPCGQSKLLQFEV